MPLPPIVLAKQGKPEAIESLLNRSIASRGFQARVLRREQLLSILIEGHQPPEQAGTVTFIQQGIEKISPANIATVRLSGQAIGQTYPEWIIDWETNANLLAHPPTSQMPVSFNGHADTRPLDTKPFDTQLLASSPNKTRPFRAKQPLQEESLIQEMRQLNNELLAVKKELEENKQQMRNHPLYRHPRKILLETLFAGLIMATVISIIISSLSIVIIFSLFKTLLG